MAWLEPLISKLFGLADILPQRADRAAQRAAIMLAQRILIRVFEQGKNSYDRQIGTYKSNPYKKKRAAWGRQTAHVDLLMTETLRNAVSVVKINGGYAVVIKASPYARSLTNAAEVAEYIEKRYGPVFKPTVKEFKDLKEQGLFTGLFYLP